MKILLDTHTFIWYVEGASELSLVAKKHIEGSANQCLVSHWTQISKRLYHH
jgi:PIN domain nuclease of toxin-antitoxin system